MWRVEQDRLGSMDFFKVGKESWIYESCENPQKIHRSDLLLEISSVFFEKQLKNFESDRRGITVKSTF